MLGVAFRLAFRELRRNLMRSMLTMLGIIIGVSAVIVLMTLGSGATQQVTQQISSLGSNMLIITIGKRMGAGQSSAAPSFKVDDAEAVAREVADLVAVAPQASSGSTAIFANENWGTTVTGSTEQYFPVNNRQIIDGRGFTSSEIRSGAAVCIIGETVRSKLFGEQNPLGSRIRLQKLSCEIIGLLNAKGQAGMGSDQDDVVVIPLRTFQRRIAGNDDVRMIQVSAREGVSTDDVKVNLQRMLRVHRHLSANEDDNFNVMDMKEISTMLSSTTKMLTSLLGAVAAVSLLVGGIGIMNIMLVSVTERTREIGIRLAIGALENEILLQFLVEAVVLSSTGGVIGIILAVVSSTLLATVLNVPLIFNLPVIVLAFAFSASVGIIFGYVPARKAARMDPIEALRHE